MGRGSWATTEFWGAANARKPYAAKQEVLRRPPIRGISTNRDYRGESNGMDGKTLRVRETKGATKLATLLGRETVEGIVQEQTRGKRRTKRTARKQGRLGMQWSYGVTTVLERLGDLLPRTLHSLALAGFGEPRLFIDGVRDRTDYEHFDLPITTRYPRVHVYPNWILSAWELYTRNPKAEYYAIFQDDFVTVRNLRLYLEKQEYPGKGYLNLYTFQGNERIVEGKQPGWYEAFTLNGKSGGFQSGRGAVALVFNRDAMIALLDSGYLAKRMQGGLHRDKGGCKNGLSRVFTHVDGAIVTAMNTVGYREYVHSPSLVQHLGDRSSIGTRGMTKAKTYPGEDFDAMDWL